MFKRTRLLAPDPAEGTLKAKESTPPADNLPTEGVSDALEFLELPDGLKDRVAAEDKAPAKTPAPEAKAVEELAQRAKAANRTPEQQTEFEKAEAAKKAAAPAKPEFSADEQAWLDLRAKASTEAEIAALDKDMPAFNEAQVAWINAQADATEADAGRPDAADAAKGEPTKVPEFSAEQKPFVDKLQADLAAAQAEAQSHSKRVEELTAEVTSLKQAAPPAAAPIHPLLLTDNPAEIDNWERGVEDFIAWGRQHWDGSDAEPAQGDKPAVPAYSAAQIRERVTFYEQQLRKLVPAARQAQTMRAAQHSEAVKAYPVLGDPKSGESQIAAGVLKAYPFLKAIPNFMLIIGDAIRGEKVREAEAKAKTTPPKRAAFRIAPKVVARGTPGGASKLASKPAADKTIDTQKFVEAKNSGIDEIEALAQTLGDS